MLRPASDSVALLFGDPVGVDGAAEAVVHGVDGRWVGPIAERFAVVNNVSGWSFRSSSGSKRDDVRRRRKWKLG
jgi:hypothetical protein